MALPGSSGGRPTKSIDKYKLEVLLGAGFTVAKIVDQQLLGFPVHRNTIARFMQRNGMTSPRAAYATISDADLSIIIKELRDIHVNSGYREIWVSGCFVDDQSSTTEDSSGSGQPYTS